MEENIYPGIKYQRLFDTINESCATPLVSQMNEIIKVVHEDFPSLTLWTPITGEASLPKDDEALCVFVMVNKNIVIKGTTGIWGQIKRYYDQLPQMTHYTTLTKLVK